MIGSGIGHVLIAVVSLYHNVYEHSNCCVDRSRMAGWPVMYGHEIHFPLGRDIHSFLALPGRPSRVQQRKVSVAVSGTVPTSSNEEPVPGEP